MKPFSRQGDAIHRRAAVRGAAPSFALASLVLLAGCGTLQPRVSQGADATVPASSAQIARQVQVSTARQRLSKAGRAQLIERLKAEGHSDQLARHLSVMTAQDRVKLFADNEVRLLIDGPQTFAAIFKAIEAARRSIWVESYIIEDADIARRLGELLMRKRAQGVAVRVIYDAVGSIGTSAEFFKTLRDAGVHTCAFNPVNPLKRPGYWGINHRDHRKIFVVDDKVAFTGGINISQVYSSGSAPFGKKRQRTAEQAAKEGWRDTQIVVEGPAAAEMARVASDTWVAQGCQPALTSGERPGMTAQAGGEARPARPVAPSGKRGDKVLQIIASGPHEEDADVYVSLLTALDAATHSIHITMAYFAPGPEMVEALCDAARRGVDVKLILPSLSDFSPVLYAGRSYYAQLLDAGVKLYELDSAVLHAKTAVVDGVWSTVGSSNMDWRSFVNNNEINVVVLGREFGQAMEALFGQDLSVSTPITPEAWRERGPMEHMKEKAARLFERLM